MTRIALLFTSCHDANNSINHIKSIAMRPIYIWQYPDWPQFTWNESLVLPQLTAIRYKQGQLTGMMEVLGFDIQNGCSLDTMTMDIVKSCEIEGVMLNSERVRSSVAKHLGVETEGLPEPDHYTEGIVEVMIDAVRNANAPFDAERLFGWHAALFPTGRSGMYKITVADWRKGEEPMQVVSGAMGHEVVHYEAPPSSAVPGMMKSFFSWVEEENPTIDPVIKAAIAHLWFVAIHPFDDGNGRLTRTITDMLMCRADALPHRYYSVSNTICKYKKDYYAALETTTVGSTDITKWLQWFLKTIDIAISEAISTTEKTVRKHLFWQRHRNVPMNERQTKMINMVWDGFEGKLTNAKWSKITKTSASTALRDIQELISYGLLKPAEGGGRNTSYVLVED